MYYVSCQNKKNQFQLFISFIRNAMQVLGTTYTKQLFPKQHYLKQQHRQGEYVVVIQSMYYLLNLVGSIQPVANRARAKERAAQQARLGIEFFKARCFLTKYTHALWPFCLTSPLARHEKGQTKSSLRFEGRFGRPSNSISEMSQSKQHLQLHREVSFDKDF